MYDWRKRSRILSLRGGVKAKSFHVAARCGRLLRLATNEVEGNELLCENVDRHGREHQLGQKMKGLEKCLLYVQIMLQCCTLAG